MKIPIQDRKKMAIQAAILRTVYASGLLAAALLAPNALQLLKYADRGARHRKALYTRIGDARIRLMQRGLLVQRDGKLTLTSTGKKSIERILMREYSIPEQVIWDGKWRMLLFDINEGRRKVRSQLRNLLNGVGFVRLQDSAWVYPYPCDEFVSLVRVHLASGVGELRVVACDALESDSALRKHFGL